MTGRPLSLPIVPIVKELATRERSQAPPLRVVWEALVFPFRPGARHWLNLTEDEVPPTILEASEPTLVVWSSLWPDRPQDLIRFDIKPDRAGCSLRWTLLSPAEPPDDARLAALRHRLNFLINAELRYSFGQ